MNEFNKSEIKSFASRSAYIANFFALLAVLPLQIVIVITRLFSFNKTSSSSFVIIESGTKGWELLEYKELYQSACEYIGENSVCKFKVDKEEDYLSQVREVILKHRPSHYIYDPRTGSQDALKGLYESFKIAVLFCYYEITPVVILADFSVRSWRVQSAVVTALRGVVVTFLSFRIAHAIFPHNRVLGPYIMPLSQKTAETLKTMSEDRDSKKSSPSNLPRVVFAGSLYEPRSSMLEKIKEELQKRGLDLEIKGRNFGTPKAPESEYWATILDSDIMITTTAQIDASNADWVWVDSLVYRFLEVMASGTLLVATEPPGARRFFIPGEDYVTFSNPNEAAELIEYYVNNPDERKKIALQGQKRAQALINSRFYFSAIDSALGRHSII